MNKINIIFIIFLLVISGCTGGNTGSNPPATPDPKPAQNAISQAQSFLQSVQSDLSTASVPVDDAKSKGVDLTTSSTLISDLQNKLSNAANVLNIASNEYNNQNYPSAKSQAEQSLKLMQEVQNQIGQIKQALENDYKSTAAKYKPLIKGAECQYRIGKKYLETVKNIGLDISSQQSNIQQILANLNQVKESYNNNNFIGLSSRIDDVTKTSQQVQLQLTDTYYNFMVEDKTKKVESEITDQEAKNYIAVSNSLRDQKKYDDSVNALNKALLTENQANILNNFNKMKQTIYNMGLEGSYTKIDDSLSLLRSHIDNGNFDDSKQDIETVKTEITAITDSASKIADADKIVDDTSKLSFWWADKPDTSISKNKLAEAKKFLKQGDIKSASDTADSTIDLLKNERNNFWNKVKSDKILGTLFDITNLISGDPEKFEINNVGRPNFEWKNVRENIYIDFNKPIADTSDTCNDNDPGEPTPPPITPYPTTTPPKKPIYFELNPGNPTSCGTTCRQTTATLTNTGDETAHNVKVNLNINNNNGENIYSTQESLGDLSGGQSISKTVVIEPDCGFLFSKCMSKPFTLKLYVIYDSGSQTFPDQQFNG